LDHKTTWDVLEKISWPCPESNHDFWEKWREESLLNIELIEKGTN